MHNYNIYKNLDTINVDPQTKEQWSGLLTYLHYHWIKSKHHVVVCPPCYVKGALRLDGVIGHKTIGRMV
jgi:hypothetical protein